MKQTLLMKWIAFRIEWHWWFIKRGRKRGNRLIDAGVPLTSPKLIGLNDFITDHGMKASKAHKRYEELAGITYICDHARQDESGSVYLEKR